MAGRIPPHSEDDGREIHRMIQFANTTQTGTTPHSSSFEDTERLGDEIARLAAHLHAATYRLLVLVRAFDEREG